MFISGTIMPVGVKNKNGWGILDSEIQNVIDTLKGKPITVCPRNGGAHACDFDPKAEIGEVKDVWYDPFVKKVRALGEITDTTARQKIKDKVWKPNWSVRLAAKDKDGWASQVEGKNITVVPEGAWSDANFDVVAAKGDGYEITLLASFSSESPAPSEPSDSNKSTVLGTVEFVPKNDFAASLGSYFNSTKSWSSSANISPDAQNGKENDNLIAGDKNMTEKKPEIKKPMEDPEVVASLQAKDDVIAELQKKLEEKVASPDVNAEPKDDKTVEDKIASKANEIAEQHIAAYKAGLARETAISEYVAAAKAHGVEAKIEMFEGLNAAQIGVFTAGLKSIKTVEDVDKIAGAKYPAATPEESGGLSVGIPVADANGNITWVTN